MCCLPLCSPETVRCSRSWAPRLSTSSSEPRLCWATVMEVCWLCGRTAPCIMSWPPACRASSACCSTPLCWDNRNWGVSLEEMTLGGHVSNQISLALISLKKFFSCLLHSGVHRRMSYDDRMVCCQIKDVPFRGWQSGSLLFLTGRNLILSFFIPLSESWKASCLYHSRTWSRFLGC